jgi:hypothetical protein
MEKQVKEYKCMYAETKNVPKADFNLNIKTKVVILIRRKKSSRWQ